MAEIDLDSLVDLDSLAGQPQQPQGGLLDRGANALRSGARNILEQSAVTSEQLGMPGVAGALRSAQPSVPQGYQSPGERFINKDGEGFGWSSFAEAVVEQFPQLGQSLAARGSGAALGAGIGSVVPGVGTAAGAAAGAFAGPALTQAYQLVGPIAVERAKNSGRDTPDKTDWAWAIATAGASGALESIGLGKLLSPGGVFGRVGKEFATEAGQSVVEQTGETAATDKGLDISPKQAIGEGLIGAGTGTSVAVPSRLVERFQNRPEPAPKEVSDDDDIRLAGRIRNQTDPEGNELDLNLRGRGDKYGGAMQAIQDTQAELLAEGRLAQAALAKLARTMDDPQDAEKTLAVFTRKGLNRQDTNPSAEDFNRFQQLFGDTAEGQELASIIRQRSKLNRFLQPNATYGPLSRVTRFLDPTERNASAFQRAIGGIGNVAALGGGILVNKAAGAIERGLGLYSPVDNFVRSAEDQTPAPFTGDRALDRVADAKQSKADEQYWNNAAELYATQTGEAITGEQLKAKAKATSILARMKADEERLKNAEMGDENRAAKSARNAQAAESLAATQERRQAAQERMAAARANQITRGQLDTMRVELARLNNEIAAGRLTITQASAKYADVLTLNKINQSNIRGRLMEIAQALAERKLSKAQADDVMQAALAEEAAKSNEEVEAAKAEVNQGATTREEIYKVGQVWKGNSGNSYKVIEVLNNGKMAIVDDEQGDPFAVSIDAERKNGWTLDGEPAYRTVKAETQTLNAREGSVPGGERWGVSPELLASEVAWLNGDNDALPDPGAYTNRGSYRYAKGTSAQQVRQELRNRLLKSGWSIAQANSVIIPLERMDSRDKLKSDREAMFDAYMETLSDLGMADDPAMAGFYDTAQRIAGNLVEAGDDKPSAKEAASAPQKTSSDPDLAAAIKAMTALASALAKTVPTVSVVATAEAAPKAAPAPTVEAATNEDTKDPVEEGKDLTTSPTTPPPAPPKPTSLDKKVKEVLSGTVKRARGIVAKVAKEKVQLARAKELAPRYGEVESAIASFENQGGITNRVKALILSSGTEFHTFLSLSNAYAGRYGLEQAEAAPVVAQAILDLQKEGTVFTPKVKPFEKDGRQVKSQSKKPLSDIQLRFNKETGFYSLLEIAKAHDRVGKIPDASTPPAPLSGMNKYQTGISPGIDGFSPEQKAQATPLIDFLNYMRNMGTGLNTGLFDLIKGQLGDTNNVAVEDALNPKNSAGKRADESGVRAFAILDEQLPTLKDGILYQEAHADSRGRVYMRNSSAFTQGGDFMKAMTRANYKAAPGQDGLKLLWQSWGNLVGPDGKASTNDRVKAYLDAVPTLLKLAENPFPKDGKYVAEIEALFQEGPLQTIAVALDTKAMVEFAKARSKTKEKNPSKLLQNPEVQADIAANWKTDAVAQFDANNNSFQLMGAFLSDPSVLQATSMMPRPSELSVDPADRRTADIYVEPAVNAVQTSLMFELGEAIKTDEGKGWLRNVIKNSVSTYVYDSTIGGASNSVLSKLVKDYSLINPAFFEQSRKDVKKTSGGTEFAFDDRKYRVAKDGTQWALQQINNMTGEWRTTGTFTTEKMAMDYPVLRSFSTTLTSAVRKNVESMYPNLRRAMNFFRNVAEWGRDNGNRPLKYQTPDGIVFSYQSDEVAKYDAMEFKIPGAKGDFTTMLPVVSEKTEAGRGLSANFTHAHDAYILREAAKRSGVKYYNPIHDSHGFHPSEAQNGLDNVLGVMTELVDMPNPFEQMVKLNGIPILKPEEHRPAVPKGPIIGAMYQADYDMLLEQRKALIKANSPRKQDKTIETEARAELRNLIVIPAKGKAGNIDPKQIRTAVS